LLPKYKGINSINWGLFNREKEWGITWHEISPQIDKGRIIYQKKFKIPENIYQIDLLDYSFILGIKAIKELFIRIKSQKYLINSQEGIDNHIFYSSNKPFIYIKNMEELIFIERCQPFTAIEKFRWNIKLKETDCTLVSTNINFKNRLKLKKSIIFYNREIYYAD
jgi:methionyl-tRNA formyltransferase